METDAEACDLLCLDVARAAAVRAALPDTERIAADAERAKALSDPTRLAIALALDHAGEACGCDLAFVTRRDERLVSHHLRALRAAGVAVSERRGKMVMYELTPDGRALLRALTHAGAVA